MYVSVECFKNCIASITFNNPLKLVLISQLNDQSHKRYFDLYRLFTVSSMFMFLEDHRSSVGQNEKDPGAGTQTLAFDLCLGRPFRSPLEGEPYIWE